MSSESTLLHSSRLTKSNSSNFNHIHILCPYKFCTCFCTICNSYSICSCICHSNKPKTQLSSLSLEPNYTNSEKTFLSDFSNNLYQKTKKFINFNDNSSSNQTQLSKKIFYAKLNKNIGDYNGRSLSDINNNKNKIKNERKQYLNSKEKYFNKSYINNFYSNDTRYNYNYDNKRILSYASSLTERDNNAYKRNSKNGQKGFETNNYSKDKINEKINKYLNLKNDKDINKDEKNKINPYNNRDDKTNYLNNNFRKAYKYKSTLNSPQKDEKIMEIISKVKLKNKYTTFEPNKNNSKDERAQLIKNYNNNKKNENNNNKNNIDENDKLLYNNYLSNKDKANQNKQINRNRNQANILNKKKNKTSYVKINTNLNNIRKNLSNNIIKNNTKFRKEKLKVISFSFSLINNIINSNSMEFLKKELSLKNQKLEDYKNKYKLISKELEFYKSEISKLKKEKNKYSKKSNIEERKIIYHRKNSDETKTQSLNDINQNNNNYRKREINDNEKYNNYNITERHEGLLSKLKINSDLNIDKDYYLSYYKSQIISDKLVFAISALTKSKSILCFDYNTKSFLYKDYADFGDFQETYIKSNENTNQKKINKSIFLTIEYNYYIITGENCDSFYIFNAVKRTINKLCSLKNNHSNGSMINYLGDIVCIGGNYNKKVELYNQAKNEWIDLPELNIERSNFTSVLIKDKYIFCLFGYNLPMKQYLNTIEYLNIGRYKESTWKYLKYQTDNINYLIFNWSLGINYKNEKIIIVGGSNGQENVGNNFFYQLILSKNFENDNNYIEKTNRKLKDINKNKCYLFDKGISIINDKNNIFYLAFDSEFRVHQFQVNNMAHDVFYLE